MVNTKTPDDTITLRAVQSGDISTFFEYQIEPTALHMAAFTAKNPFDEWAYMSRWERILSDKSIIKQTILYKDAVAGYIVQFEQSSKAEISYWLGKAFWGKGIATKALKLFLDRVETRPLYARAAKDNVGSIRVLQKCGFVLHGKDKGLANARDEVIEEFIFELR